MSPCVIVLEFGRYEDTIEFVNYFVICKVFLFIYNCEIKLILGVPRTDSRDR